MALKDNDANKWGYSEHCKVKHILLEKYLRSWIPILGKYNSKIAYFDGFAGRGQYSDGNFGSPVLAMKACEDSSTVSSVQNLEFNCVFIEQNKDNYINLKQVVEEQKINHPKVTRATCTNDNFNNLINSILDKLNDKLVPSFFFIDPFGFTGVPFSTIKRIMAIPKTEVFFNFMIRDINRFISLPNQENNMNMLFGNDSWKKYIQLSGKEREYALRDLYMHRLIEENCANYTLPFRICEDNKCSTLYYLIYATKSFKGLEIMKSIMFNQNEHFAYLGPKEYEYQNSRSQLRLFDPNIADLKNFLLNFLKGKPALSYDKIRELTYTQTPCIDKHYREALKELEKENLIRVIRITSKSARGLSKEDKIIVIQN